MDKRQIALGAGIAVMCALAYFFAPSDEDGTGTRDIGVLGIIGLVVVVVVLLLRRNGDRSNR